VSLLGEADKDSGRLVVRLTYQINEKLHFLVAFFPENIDQTFDGTLIPTDIVTLK